MPTEEDLKRAQRIVGDHRRHLLRRLTTRSPLLRFLPSARRVDVHSIFEGILPNPPAVVQPNQANGIVPVTDAWQLMCVLSAGGTAEIRNPPRQAIATCAKIRAEADDHRHTTGQHALYIGHPIMFIPLEDGGKFLLAPILLWPLNVQLPSGGRLRIERLTEDGEALPCRVNPLLIAWAKQERNIAIPELELEDFTLDDLDDLMARIFDRWPGIRREALADHSDAVPARDTFNAWARDGSDPRILPCAVLGLAPFKGQALLADLEAIAEKLGDKDSNMGALGRLIFPRPAEDGNDGGDAPADRDRYLVIETDHSQEHAVWQARERALMVLHGPPGTGKSQTIVNLIADALARNQRVLVVCQKEPALAVVKKRLDAVGLGDLAVKIDEPQADRRRTLRSIRSIERDFPPFLETDGDRPRLVGAIQRLENVLDEYYAALWDTNEGQHRRYADLRAELEQLSDVTRTKLHRDYRNDCASPADEDELQALLEEIERLKELVVECSYLENPWSACIGAEQITSTALEDLRACLDRALEQAAGLTWWGLRFIRQANLVWLAEHPWMGDWGTSFLPIDVRESHEAFARIACDLRNWAREHHADSSKVIDTIRRSPKPADAIRAFADRVGQLPTIAEIHGRRHDMAPVDSLWHRIEIRQVDLWAHHLRAAAYRKWWENLEKRRPRLTTSAARIRDWRGELRQSVERKRDLDQLLVRGRYRERLSPRNRLEDLDLLRINSAQGRPRTTLRNLYARGFESLHRLYPVLLTNPDHVSSLLPLEAAKYDLLIMDEASQVFMADAMPALYRAKRAIICGDQMQMPPSDFFSPGMGMGDDFEEETDAEDGTQPADLNRLVPAEGEYCLLDAAVHAVREGSPDNVRLRVHYRSEAKELVDFSNHAFYDGGLLIPPGNWVAPSFLTTPIQLQHVGGTCEGGVNGDEALGVVRVLKEKIWLDNDSPSVGVIAFNIKQAERIEDVLFEKSMQDDDFRGRLECERARRGEGGEDESFFVRSVEHVQGDERDIIIFSTTYGPGSHSFGPISNKEKGRRRLNVAVTRAKRGIIVLTSLDIDRISNDDEQEQRERYYFWKYLCYARAVSNGRREEMRAILNAFRAQGAAVGGEAESPFEADVAAYLRRQGYQVDYQVGEGGFRIDLGVKRRPEDPRYLCGVECDGRAYHREWSARLYDVWRQGILEKKGWKIVRVWSTDWFNNPQPSRERLLREMG